MDIMSHAVELANKIIANQEAEKTVFKNKPVEATGGQAEKSFDMKIVATDTILELYGQTKFFPWTSFDLVNNGPSPVYFCVNEWTSPEAAVQVGQAVTIDFNQKGTINKVYLLCDKDESTTVSLFIKK